MKKSVEKVSFEWSHRRILLTDSKLGLHYNWSERLKNTINVFVSFSFLDVFHLFWIYLTNLDHFDHTFINILIIFTRSEGLQSLLGFEYW